MISPPIYFFKLGGNVFPRKIESKNKHQRSVPLIEKKTCSLNYWERYDWVLISVNKNVSLNSKKTQSKKKKQVSG